MHQKKQTQNITFSCKICEDYFLNRSSLKRHQMAHSGLRPYTCNNCNKTFKEENHLGTHKLIHQGKTHKCKFCEKSFTQKGNLMTHYRTHSGEKPFSCDECEQTFTQSSHLLAHQRFHAGEKPFVCIVCKKYFTQASNLIEHGRLHEEKQHVCKECGNVSKRTSIWTSTNKHILRRFPLAIFPTVSASKGSLLALIVENILSERATWAGIKEYIL